MLRFRFGTRPPGGLRPWAAGLLVVSAGPALASSAVETLDAAVVRELNALRSPPAVQRTSHVDPRPAYEAPPPRQLPGVNDGSLRPVSGYTGQGTAVPRTAIQRTAAQPAPAQPTPAQLEVMRQLEEMYQRDGRGPMPSLRMKDAPNTRLPNGLRAVPNDGSAAPVQSLPPAATVQPTAGTDGSSMGVPPAPAPASASSTAVPTRSRPAPAAEEPKRGFFGWLRRDPKPQTSHRAEPKKEGLFSRMFRPFRRDDEPQQVAPSTPPVPPTYQEQRPSTGYASQPAPRPIPSSPSRAISPADSYPPPAPPVVTAPAAPVPSTASAAPAALPPAMPPAGEQYDATPFAMTPVTHPLDDAFSSVRGWRAPLASGVDPEFADADVERPAPPQAPIAELPPTEVPAAIAADDPFGSSRPGEPAAEPSLEEPQAPQPQQTAKARYAELQRKLAERAGLGGFQGFCPVALHDSRALVDSRPEFISFYEGRSYELSSAEAKARFDADPERYAPVNRGNDVVLTSRGESAVEGNLNYAVWYKDRLYMFRTAETLREFDADPQKYAVNP